MLYSTFSVSLSVCSRGVIWCMHCRGEEKKRVIPIHMSGYIILASTWVLLFWSASSRKILHVNYNNIIHHSVHLQTVSALLYTSPYANKPTPCNTRTANGQKSPDVPFRHIGIVLWWHHCSLQVDISVSAEYVVTAFRSELNGVRMQYFSQFLFTISVGLDPTLFPFPLSWSD